MGFMTATTVATKNIASSAVSVLGGAQQLGGKIDVGVPHPYRLKQDARRAARKLKKLESMTFDEWLFSERSTSAEYRRREVDCFDIDILGLRSISLNAAVLIQRKRNVVRFEKEKKISWNIAMDRMAKRAAGIIDDDDDDDDYWY